MGEVIPFRQKATPDQRTEMMNRLAELSREIDTAWKTIEQLERERENLRRRLGFLAVERGTTE